MGCLSRRVAVQVCPALGVVLPPCSRSHRTADPSGRSLPRVDTIARLQTAQHPDGPGAPGSIGALRAGNTLGRRATQAKVATMLPRQGPILAEARGC